MIEIYNTSNLSYFNNTITNDMVTGKYKEIRDTIYIEIREKNSWITRLLTREKYFYYYINEDNVQFVDINYFDCKGDQE